MLNEYVRYSKDKTRIDLRDGNDFDTDERCVCFKKLLDKIKWMTKDEINSLFLKLFECFVKYEMDDDSILEPLYKMSHREAHEQAFDALRKFMEILNEHNYMTLSPNSDYFICFATKLSIKYDNLIIFLSLLDDVIQNHLYDMCYEIWWQHDIYHVKDFIDFINYMYTDYLDKE